MVDYVLLYTMIDCVLCYGYSFQSTQSPSVSQGVTCNLHYKQDKQPSSQLLDITIHILVHQIPIDYLFRARTWANVRSGLCMQEYEPLLSRNIVNHIVVHHIVDELFSAEDRAKTRVRGELCMQGKKP